MNICLMLPLQFWWANKEDNAMKKEKRFVKPEAEIVEFCNDDIILTSGEGDVGGINYPWWNGDEDLPSDTEEF